MAKIYNTLSEHVFYTLQAPNTKSLVLETEPVGWDDDNLVLKRDTKYHGMFFSFTGSLKFYGKQRDYIKLAYKIGGINTNLFLIKNVLTLDNGEVKKVLRYIANADFNTMTDKDGELSVNFNSNDLETIIKTHENDDFEMEIKESIDGVKLKDLDINKVTINGIDLSAVGESMIENVDYSNPLTSSTFLTPRTQFISEGMNRHNAVQEELLDMNNITADNLIYTDLSSDDGLPFTTVKLNYDIHFEVKNNTTWVQVGFHTLQYDSNTANYTVLETIMLEERTFANDGLSGMNKQYDFTGVIERNLNWEQGILFFVKFGGGDGILLFTNQEKQSTFKLTEVSRAEPSVNLDFAFLHDIGKRLMYILTGKENVFRSKFLGRKEIGYKEDGFAGLVGIISGFWARAFDRNSDTYKSPIISLQTFFDSLKAEFNIGAGIESDGFEQIFRIEDLKYFYQDDVVIKLDKQITGVSRKVDSTLFFSSATFGYDKGGDYENAVGLDEPNIQRNYVTPIRKSKNKYNAICKFRADDTALEIVRRKPQMKFPKEDTQYDDHLWLLDLKRTEVDGHYEQKDYTDRLQSEPTGILSPLNYKSYLFTPLRMAMRHAWIFKAGMIPYNDSYLRFISSNANSNLETHANPDWNLGLDIPYKESDNIKLSDLEEPKFEPEIVTFNYDIDDDLMGLIMSKTKKEINGEIEEIPNFYFKFEYKNENGDLERGYLLELNPKDKGTIKMLKVKEI